MKQVMTRSVPFELVRATTDGDGLTMEGYAAVFNTTTRVADRMEALDLGLDVRAFDEQIAPSAFNKSINDRAQWPLLMFDHGRHIMIGSMPLGVITQMRADRKGLFVRARLTDNWLTSPVRDAIAGGAITGMSFLADPIQERIDKSVEPPMVTRTELRLLELGPVVVPAYDTTSVTVRSKAIAEALYDPEARGDLARALLAPVDQAPDPSARPAPDDNPNADPAAAQRHQDGEPAGPDGPAATAGPPGNGHPTDSEPPAGHSSMSRGYMTARLALINARIDSAERSAPR